MKKTLWLEVTLDEYELPLAVADTARQLSVMIWKHPHQVQDEYSKWLRGIRKQCRYRKVELECEE